MTRCYCRGSIESCPLGVLSVGFLIRWIFYPLDALSVGCLVRWMATTKRRGGVGGFMLRCCCAQIYNKKTRQSCCVYRMRVYGGKSTPFQQKAQELRPTEDRVHVTTFFLQNERVGFGNTRPSLTVATKRQQMTNKQTNKKRPTNVLGATDNSLPNLLPCACFCHFFTDPKKKNIRKQKHIERDPYTGRSWHLHGPEECIP